MTIMLPDDVLASLREEACRRGISVAEIVREAVQRHLQRSDKHRTLAFFAVGEGRPADASEHVDEHVTAALRARALRRG